MMQKIKPFLPQFMLAILTLISRYTYSGFERTVWGDEPFYLWLGRNWFRGDDYNFAFTGHWDYHHTPGYPFITAVLTQLTGDMQRASEWSFILFSVLLVLIVYALARRIYGWRSAFAAGVILALAPASALMPLYWGTMTEIPYWALAFTGVYFAHRTYRHFRYRDVALSGVFLALAYYMRPEAVVFLGAMGLILGVRALSQAPRLRRLTYPALLGVVFLLAVFPYLYRVRQETGTWTISQKVGAHFATAAGLASGRFQQFDVETWGLDSSGQEVRFFSRETADASAEAYISADPAGYARIIYGNTHNLLRQLISPHLLPAFALIFLGLALFRKSWSRSRAWDELFLFATLLPGLSFVFFFVQERYIAALIPTLFIWFGHGVMEMGDWLVGTGERLLPEKHARWPGWKRLIWLPLLVLAFFYLLYTPRQIDTATNPGSTREAHDLAATTLASTIEPDDIVMARYVSIAFHAGAEWIPTPAADVDAVLAYAQRKGADYWAIDEFEAHSLRLQFSSLFDNPDAAPPELQFVTRVEDESGSVVIYRIKP
ncbi:MAG TPA: glycosyltransferase family 39 protein [Caldilineae bacterium]|nr:glycosyltransferase family 39 protein [Caldilineae bacterium]